MLRARFLPEFILSGQGEILRYSLNDSEGLGMTAGMDFHIGSRAPPFQTPGEKRGITVASDAGSCRSCVRAPGMRPNPLAAHPYLGQWFA